MKSLHIYNTLTRQKETFEPLHAPYVGMYLCGPTVYGHAHLGHARSALTGDILYRYLKHLGYQVRYVRNITDVGHLERDADQGEDKIAQQARREQLEPAEIAQQYTNSYHTDMALLNMQTPAIEPRASGHIMEQIDMIQQICKAGFAYQINGSVYFDVEKYNNAHNYGCLSGRIIDDLLSGTRALQQQHEKKQPMDFALWKKATPAHIMRWPSPWGVGFPGWHLECSAMAAKYLGKQFDIHAGGMDLVFPHHECEMAQAQVAHQIQPAKYWVHHNLVTVNDQKMGKSLGNAITLQQLFQGHHALLDQAYSPMTLRFFMLQAHYRSALNFSTEALKAAKKGYLKLMNGLKAMKQLTYIPDATIKINEAEAQQIYATCHACTLAMDDDLNTAKTIAQLFHVLKYINGLATGTLPMATLGKAAFEHLKKTYKTFVQAILGLQEEKNISAHTLLDILLALYRQAKAQKQYDRVEEIREKLRKQGIVLQDKTTDVDWAYAL